MTYRRWLWQTWGAPAATLFRPESLLPTMFITQSLEGVTFLADSPVSHVAMQLAGFFRCAESAGAGFYPSEVLMSACLAGGYLRERCDHYRSWKRPKVSFMHMLGEELPYLGWWGIEEDSRTLVPTTDGVCDAPKPLSFSHYRETLRFPIDQQPAPRWLGDSIMRRGGI